MKRGLFSFFIFLTLHVPLGSYGQAVKGVLRYAGEERLALDGEWAFYWKQLLPPGDKAFVASEARYVTQVSYWNTHKELKEKLPAFGYATYRLVVESTQDYRIAIEIPGFNLSYALFLNGELISGDGVVSDSKGSYVPDWTVSMKTVMLHEGENEIVVQVANFDHSNGGFFKPIIIGDPDILPHERDLNLIIETFNIGGVFLIGCFFVGLFFYLGEDKSFLFYGLFVIMYALYISNYGQYVFGTVFPAVPARIKLKITYLTMYLAWLFYTLFLCELFREDFHKIVSRIALIIAVPLCLSALVLPMSIYTLTLVPFSVVALVYIIYGFYITLVARVRKRGGSLSIFVGLALCTLAIMILSAYHYNLILTRPNAISMLFTATFFVMSFAFAEKIGKAFSSAKALQLETASQKREIEIQAKELKQLDEAKSRFFANISHEFRTPLTMIFGPVRELLLTVHDSRPRKYLQTIQNNASRLLKLVNQILELAKLDAGHQMLVKEYVDVSKFINETVESFQLEAKSNSIKLLLRASDQISGWTDPDALEKIVLNLLSNAFKFTPGGGTIALTLSLEGTKARIDVEDTGNGIPQDQLPFIFDRFYHTESDKQASSGIGLSLVKALVDQLNGEITVESEPGVRTCFRLFLPLEKDETEGSSTIGGAAFASEEAAGVTANGETPTILVIEDNDEVRQLIADVLSHDFEVLSASNGTSGIATAIEQMPDGIICDLMMPGVDGFEVCAQLKQNEKTSHIPIVMLTAKADKESKIKGLETAADDYLTKPFDQKELIVRLRNLLESRRQLMRKYSQQTILKPQEIAVSSVDKVFLEKVIAAVNTHLADEGFSVDELSREVGMSKSQLNRKLQALIGQTPNKLIRSFRLQQAYELLEKNAGSIAEIAYMTGFSSPNYFNAVFKDEFGIVPGQVQRNKPD
ncbi:MAG: response regulator [Imperialibacter sp.]|uniref:ATP-binding protein n=1 Tax=Imperialibacter sp. TaxID=2038411 RepID=UPI0032EC14B8